MKMEHQQLAAGKWQELSLAEQLANVGAEVGRALRWQEKGNAEYSRLAFERALELIDLTIDDGNNKNRLKEIIRLREALADYFTAGNSYKQTADSLNNYFYSFNFKARTAI